MRSRTSASATPMPGRKAASRSGGHSPPGSALQAWTRESVARGAADDRRGPPITTLSSPGGRPVITRACTSSDIPLRLRQLELLGCLAQQLAHGATKLEHLATVAAVLERVPVSGRCAAAGGSAVYPATFPAAHRRGPAGPPAARPGIAAVAPVHGRWIRVHGLDPHFPGGPLPHPGRR